MGAADRHHGVVADDIYSRLLNFLTRLENARIFFTLSRARADAVMVLVTVPGQRWEVEFMRDGSVEIERFASVGGVESDPTLLDRIVSEFAD